jgi:beta-barrel assembly-enhancing protease
MRNRTSRPRSWLALCAAVAVGFGVSVAYVTGAAADATAASTPEAVGTEGELPDLGSAANAAISLEDEYQVGLAYTRQMRQQGMILEDPEVSEYIQDIGHQLSSYAEEGQHQFSYFVVKDPDINAMAIPGGFIFANSGLVLATSNESELAAVLAHETAHVTQRHIARSIVDQSHSGLISTAAMLAAIILGATAGGGSPSAMEGAIVATQGAAIQHQINYSRSQEFEADRIGIYTMASAGFDPLAMADFFAKFNRNTPNPARVDAIGFLLDHPVTSDRIAEARNRAAQIGRIHHVDSLSYGLMRERLRSLVGDPNAAVDYYTELVKNGGGRDLDDRYGMDVALTYAKNPVPAIKDLKALLEEYPKITQLYDALGQAYLANSQPKESQAVLEQAQTLFPRNVPVTIRLAQTYMQEGKNKRAHQILLDLFNIVEPTPDQTRLIAKAAHAAGDVADSYYYMSEFYIMNGELDRSSSELRLALALPDLNPIQRARFSARLEEVRAALARDKKRNKSRNGDGDGGDGGNGRGGDGDGGH